MNAQISASLNRNDLIELSKQASNSEYLIKTTKPGANLIIKLNNDYMDINILKVDFARYALGQTGSNVKKFDILFLDFGKLKFPMLNTNTNNAISVEEIPMSNGLLLRRLDQNHFLCTNSGQTQIKLNALANPNLNSFLNMNHNTYQLNVESYKTINIDENADHFDFFSSNFYEFKFDNAISLKSQETIGKYLIDSRPIKLCTELNTHFSKGDGPIFEFEDQNLPFVCKFKLADNSDHHVDYEDLNKLFLVKLVFMHSKWQCELKFQNIKLNEYYDLVKLINRAPTKINIWIEDKNKKSDQYAISLYPPFQLNQVNQDVIDFEVRADLSSREVNINIVDYMASCLDVTSTNNLISVTKQGSSHFQSKYLLTLYVNNLLTTDMFIEFKCSLNSQHIKLPLRLQFKNLHSFPRQATADENESFMYSILTYMQANSNQIITFLAFMSLILISLLFLLKTKLQATQPRHLANANTFQNQSPNRSFDRFQTTFHKNLNSSNYENLRNRSGLVGDTQGYSWSTPNRLQTDSNSSTSPSPLKNSQNKSIDRIKLFSIDANGSSPNDNSFFNRRHDN